MKFLNQVRRRLHQIFDFLSVFIARIFQKSDFNSANGAPSGTCVFAVNFNTLQLTKLMLLTLADKIGNQIDTIVMIDNASKDGSYEFLKKLSSKSDKILLVSPPPRFRHHGSGLRWGIQHISQTARYEYYLICDTDIIFLREDFLEDTLQSMKDTNASLIGEFQYDVGESYVHPSCMILKSEDYHDNQIWPFLVHGAPALKMEQSMKLAGMHLEDFPIRSENYIVHKGQGTVARIKTYAPRHAHSTVQGNAHYHGNPDGEALWTKTEEDYSTLLDPQNEDKAIEHIATSLK